MSYTDQLRDLQEQQIVPVDTEEAAFNKLLGYNIAAARGKKGWAQQHLADAIGVTQSAWSRKERGESSLTVYDLMMCAKALNLPVTRLIPS